MAKIRCFLCGGRVSKGVCRECGMPQRQHARNYSLNESSCDDLPLTHVHTEKKDEPKSSMPKKVAVIVALLVVIVVIANLITMASDLFSDSSLGNLLFDDEEIGEIQEAGEILTIEDEYYEYVMYELAETGESYEAYLPAGYYVTGYHLPEGTYTFVAQGDIGYVNVEDWNNSIYFWEAMAPYSEEGYMALENVRLYNGAILYIDGGLSLSVATDNAGEQKDLVDNPLQDPVKIPYAESGMLAGEDFAPGTYDLYLYGDWDYVDLFSMNEDGEEEFVNSFYIRGEELTEDENNDYGSYACCIRNVTIEEGTYVRISYPENVLELVPSEFVVPQEGDLYGEYY